MINANRAVVDKHNHHFPWRFKELWNAANPYYRGFDPRLDMRCLALGGQGSSVGTVYEDGSLLVRGSAFKSSPYTRRNTHRSPGEFSFNNGVMFTAVATRDAELERYKFYIPGTPDTPLTRQQLEAYRRGQSVLWCDHRSGRAYYIARPDERVNMLVYRNNGEIKRVRAHTSVEAFASEHCSTNVAFLDPSTGRAIRKRMDHYVQSLVALITLDALPPGLDATRVYIRSDVQPMVDLIVQSARRGDSTEEYIAALTAKAAWFPSTPYIIEYLLRWWRERGDTQARRSTLHQLAQDGKLHRSAVNTLPYPDIEHTIKQACLTDRLVEYLTFTYTHTY